MIFPEVELSRVWAKVPRTSGGIRVPNTVHRPSTTAMPSDRPR
jgi:hypothetical protein